MKIIFLILFGMSLLQADFTKGGDVVVDNSSNLMWEDTEGALVDEVSWSDAITRCEDLTLAGYDNWRLPNINELMSIRSHLEEFEHGREVSTEDGITYPHWSSTSGQYMNVLSSAYTIEFNKRDEVKIFFKTSTGHARCVRGGEE